MQKIIAIHQPNYFPWLGYFLKIALCDHFIFLDDVEVNLEGYTRRVKIREDNISDNLTWLSVPLKHTGHKTPIIDLIVKENQLWKEDHWNKICQAYKNAPLWKHYKSKLLKLMDSLDSREGLSSMNQECIKKIADLLELQTAFHRSSEMDVFGKASEYTSMLTSQLEGTHYIRGKGERAYSNYENPEIMYVELDAMGLLKKYSSRLETHILGTSILDAILHIGPQKLKPLLKELKKSTVY